MEIPDKHSSPEGGEFRKHDQSALKALAAGLLSGCFLFVHLYGFELIFTYGFSRKLAFPKILYYLCAYLIIGALFGLGVGALNVLITALGEKNLRTNPERLFVSLAVTGFVCFLGLVVLNAHYLPYASLISPRSILLNALLFAFCFPLALYLYSAARRLDCLSPMPLIMSVGISLAAAIVAFNAFASRTSARGELRLIDQAGILLLFVICAALVAGLDFGATSILAGIEGKRNAATRIRHILTAKIVITILLLSTVVYVRHYKPLVATDEQAQSSAAAGEKPNIIILVLDTVRQDQLSPYGSERDTSPNINRFAGESWVFDAYSPASWTLPSHAAIVTGLFPTETGTGPGRNYRIDPRNETLAEILKKNGYLTAAVISNHMILDQSSGFAQGFDFYYANQRETEPAFSFFASYFLKKFFPAAPVFRFLTVQRAERINEIALQWIAKHRHAPFFLFLNYMEAHAPYVPPPPYDRQWFSNSAPADFFSGDAIWRDFCYDVNAGKRKVSEVEREYLLSQYDGEIAYLDFQIGLFWEELKKLGVFDNSLIVLTSDHGELLSEHGLLQHPRVLYQELIRVPLIVKFPAEKEEKPARIPGTVSLVDLFGSILKYVGIPHKSRPGSVDIFETKAPAVFSETHSISGESGPEFLDRFGSDLYSVIDGNYKLIYSIGRTYQLFDITRDPFENDNLLGKNMGQDEHVAFARLKNELGSWMDDINSNRLEPAELSQKTDAEIHSRLKALGYVQ